MGLFNKKSPAVKIRGVHLDLKGLPPTMPRLLQLLDLFHEIKINCLLVEWEDMYPWQKYPGMRSKTAYSQPEIEQFLVKAQHLGIEIIPLIQSYGHLETLLKLPRFKKLREHPDDVRDLCPCNPDSRKVVINLIADVLSTHKRFIKHFHLGGDEAWSIGSCPKCKNVVQRFGKAYLYRKQIEPLLDYVNSFSIRPIIWDDMLREWTVSEICKISNKTDLMVWSYRKEALEKIANTVIPKFVKSKATLWGASAFKGADGSDIDLPNYNNRVTNMLTWNKIAIKYKFKGVVATGWSRYNTFYIPCEPLESSLDCLVLASAIMWDNKLPKDYLKEARNFLVKGKLKTIAREKFVNCLKIVENLSKLRKDIEGQLKMMSNFPHLCGEPERYNKFRVKQIVNTLKSLLKNCNKLTAEFVKVYKGLSDDFWTKRFMKSRIIPLENRIKCVLKNVRQTAKNTGPRLS